MSILEDMPTATTRKRPRFDGSKLQYALMEQGMNSYELAQKIGISESAISLMLRSLRHNPATWGKAARILKKPVHYFFADDANGDDEE